MAQKTRRLIVREMRRITTGRTSKGAEYVICQVVATTPEGQPINHNLRTFEDLPRDQVIEVSIERHNSEQYGESFTLKQVGRRSSRDELKALAERVAKLEQAVYSGTTVPTEGAAHAAPPQPTTAPALPPPLPPPPPTAQPASVERAVPNDNDIPF